ncbi:glutathione S-transferase family protein [Massilia endophytica]|uniref:glutathione S-transferase family protein n=1 Tax=Massilia endophytica TaxID=2899220 RepID=UPI001E4CC2B8|nr:glutathione S-transferase family protein [Massilia endophytica]UGQ49008.1 glutathione S-transferase family protein [Massilia endophytica]
MKLYVSARAPNPRRVTMFAAEKGLQIQQEEIDILNGQHRSEAYLAKNPLGRVPALELDDGRVLCETRAICTYLEGLQPEPNLMGRDFEERAFIEMWDRRVEFHLHLPIVHAARHTHPVLAVFEKPQIAEFAAAQAERLREAAGWLDGVLGKQPYMAGERFTIADITAFCALEFAKGLIKFRPGQEGFANLQAWRDRIGERESAKATL